MEYDEEEPKSSQINDNVTWYQELVESWKSYDLLEKIIITMRLSLIIIVFIILIWF